MMLFSCAKKQPEVSWLKIDKWVLEENPDAVMPQGELTHNLSQIFVSMGGEVIGVFELPAKIPIIGDGKQEFVLQPGIIVNGISETKLRYPFAENVTVKLDLIKNDTISYTPTTKYYSTLNFLIEDFESPSMQIDVNENSLGTVGRNNDPEILQWGNRYGEIILTDVDSLVMFVTNFGKSLPKFGTNVFMEFDYMNTNSALTSVVSYGNGAYHVDPFVLITPQKKNKAEWKHFYLDLKENISALQNVPFNEVQMAFLKDELGEDSYFYIDNIKIIYP